MKTSNMNYGATKRTYPPPVASANNTNISSHTKKAKRNEQSSAEDEFPLNDYNDELEALSQAVIEGKASRNTTKSTHLSNSKSPVHSSVFKGHTITFSNGGGNMPLGSTKTNYSTTKTGENGKRLRPANPERFAAVPAPMKRSQLTGPQNVSQSSSFNLTSVPSTCREDPKYIRKQTSQIQVRAKRLKNAKFKETMKKVVIDVDRLQEQKKQNIMQSPKPSGSSKQGDITKSTKSSSRDHLAMGSLLKATKELEKCSIYTSKMKRINESFSFLNKYTHYDT